MLSLFQKWWPAGLGLLLVFVDQVTKWLFLRLYPDWLFANHAFAFSLPLTGWLLFVVLLGASSLLLWFLLRQWTRFTQLERFAWVLVCAGGLGNIIDRVWFGYVRDFLHLGTGVFNAADLFIFAGAGLLIVIAFSPRRVS